MRTAIPYFGALAIIALLSACAGITNLTMPAGSREWVIPVENLSAEPARLLVAEDIPGIGQTVGTATPETVAAGATESVTFTVPPGDEWAIFVNPGPDRGPLILARDVPSDASGPLPLHISVGANGGAGVAILLPNPDGWFGR